MPRTPLVLLSILIACVGTLTPVLTSIYFAGLEADRENKQMAANFARQVEQRAEMISREAHDALAEVERSTSENCSAADLVEMGRINYRYRFVRDVGRYQGDTYVCSVAFGNGRASNHGSHLDKYPAVDGRSFWVPRRSGDSAAPDELLLGRNGVYISIDPQAYVDQIEPAGRQIAVIHPQTHTLVAMTPGADGGAMLASWKDHGNMPGTQWTYSVYSQPGNTLGVVVRYPKANFDSLRNRLLLVWLSVGSVVGALVGWAALRWSRQQLSFPSRLARAIRRDELTVVYQPIVALADGRCVGVEALVRWNLNGQPLSPEVFIPIAESNGLIEPLTDLVLAHAMRDLDEVLHRHSNFYFSINVSSEDLRTDRFLEVLKSKMNATGLAPEQIRIEVTEREAVGDEARRVLRKFREAGHPIYVDDFGTGYSSLKYLQELSVDVLKIDKAFVDTVNQGAASSIVAPHIIAMAHELKLALVAEGIEHTSQEEYLRERGVQYGQGWLYGKAMTVEALETFLNLPERTPLGRGC